MKIESIVSRIETPTKEEFTERYLVPQRPVVITGATAKWRAHSTWTLDYLRSRIGGRKVRVTESPTTLYPDFFSGVPSRQVETDFAEFIDLLASNRPERNQRYLNGDETTILSSYTQLNPAFAPLCNDFEPPAYCDRQQIKTVGFWMSAKGVVSSLHYDFDGSHNLNVQVRGRKRVLLFSPSEGLYPFSGLQASRNAPNFSQVNILDPDEGRFPAFRSAKCVEAVLEEGDMLFVPSYWYHALFHLGEININVNFWWQPTTFHLNKTSFRSTFLALVGLVLTGKPFGNPRELVSAIEKLSTDQRRLLQQVEDLIPKQYRL